ncbi:MAG: hypothetical protein ND895_05410 [Pyrinomonadaceae bacterium]|nr:hypothetical protein [Pyrinomonadaceae bacterium]
MKIELKRNKRSVHRMTALAAFGLIVLFGTPHNTLAQWATSGNNINNTNTGNVGVGTSSPADLLHVAKSQNAPTTVRVDNPDASGNAAYSGIRFYQGGTLRGQLTSINDGFTGGVGGAGALQLWNLLNANLVFGTNATERVRIQGNGNVGIGSTAPAELVHVRKDQNASTQLLVENATAGASANADLQVKNNLGNIAQFGLYSSTTTAAGAIASGNAYTYTTSPAMVIMANHPSGVIKFATGGLNERMRIDASGNLGVGTTTPSDLMQVDSASGWGLRIRYTGDGQYLRLSANQVSSFTSAGAGRDLYLNPAGGNVGIGTATPISGNKLDVNGNTNVTGNLTVAGTGNINASGTITGNTINAKYQDVAEWVESSQSLPVGTVVVLDHTRSNQVVASTEAYDTRVAGVISAQPGITLGESGEAKVLVATTGRVRIKVDATHAPIQVGDLLVTGDREGFAMKSLPINIGGVQLHRPGTLVGKALEPLAKGTGEILVLLSLQ